MLTYKKPVMRKKELVEEYGIPEGILDRAYRTKGQTFAQKITPGNKNSPIVFDTAEFEKWRLKDIEMQNKAIIRG